MEKQTEEKLIYSAQSSENVQKKKGTQPRHRDVIWLNKNVKQDETTT